MSDELERARAANAALRAELDSANRQNESLQAENARLRRALWQERCRAAANQAPARNPPGVVSYSSEDPADPRVRVAGGRR